MTATKQHRQPIRTAIVGFGVSGSVFHAPLIAADPAYSLEMIVTSNSERATQAATLYPHTRIVPTTTELYAASSNLDLVILATPPKTHYKLASTAIEHGLHLVIDKPFAANSEQGKALIDQAAAAGLLLTVFQNRRWDSDFLTLKKLISTGELGQICSFESRFEWWLPEGFQNWRDRATLAEGGGILHDLGAHLIDQAIQLFGPVSSSHGETARVTDSNGSDGDQEAFVSLLHVSGVRSRLWMNGMAAQVGARFHVLGTTSGYTKWGLDSQEAALAAGNHPSDPEYGLEPEQNWGRLGVDAATKAVAPERGAYPGFYCAFAQAFKGTGPLPVDPADSLEVLRLIEKIHRQV